MKNILFLLVFITAAGAAGAQATTKIQADSVKMYQMGGSSELILENNTRNKLGAYLQNRFNGRTRFSFVLDSVWFSNGLLRFRYGADTIAFNVPVITAPLSTNKYFTGYKTWGTLGVDSILGLATALASKLNLSDTSAMLSGYVKGIPTLSEIIKRGIPPGEPNVVDWDAPAIKFATAPGMHLISIYNPNDPTNDWNNSFDLIQGEGSADMIFRDETDSNRADIQAHQILTPELRLGTITGANPRSLMLRTVGGNYYKHIRFYNDDAVTDTVATWRKLRSSGYLTTETDPTSVHLTGNQTVAGIKTFSDQLFWKGGTSSTYGGLVTQPYFSNTHGTVVLYGSENTYSGSLMTIGLTGSRTYYLPDASGTLALTSDIGSGTTITNNANNRLITGSATANTLEGESNLTWDGTLLNVTGNSKVSGTTGLGNISADPTGAANGDLYYNSTTNKAKIYTSGAFQNLATEGWVLSQIQSGLVVTVDQSNPNATDTRTGLSRYSLTAPFLTIQAAFNAAVGGDIIQVKNGTYYENVQYHFNTALKQVPLWIFENATLNGGNGIAFSGQGDVRTTIFLKNSHIINNGNASDRNSAPAIFCETMVISVYGDNKALSSIESVEGVAHGGNSNGTNNIGNVTIQSTNYYAIAGAFNMAAYKIDNCIITSINNTAVAGHDATIKNTYIKGGLSAYRFSGYLDGGWFLAGNFENCYFEGVTGHALGDNVNIHVGGGNGLVLRNCTFVSKYETIKQSGSGAANITIENAKITVTDPSVLYAYSLQPTQGIVRITNTITNVLLFNPTYLATRVDVIRESNTSVLDNSVFFGVKTGFGTQEPTSAVDINGANGYNQFRLRTQYTPTGTSDANGNAGDISVDNNYFYYKTSSGWKRSALSTF